MLTILIQKILSLAMVMSAGFMLTRFGPLTDDDSRSLSRLTVWLVMPCSIFSAFQIRRSPDIIHGLLLVLLAAILVHLAAILLTGLLKHPLQLTPVEQTSVLYTNAGNLIIPLVSAMLGREWVIYTCAYILIQTLLTWSHARALICGERGIDWGSIFHNPNIWALFFGVVFFCLNIPLPALLGDTISGISSMVGPLSMLVIGMNIGCLPLGKLIRNKRIWLVTILRLLCYPLLILGLLLGLGRLFPWGVPYFLVTMLAASAPSAALITHICLLYGKDPGDASSICVVTTLLCSTTIPLMVWLYLLLTGI